MYTLLLRQFAGICIGIVVHITVEDDFRAVALRPVHLDQRCDGRHDDHGLAAEFLGGKRHTLCMVARRRGNESRGFVSSSVMVLIL